MLDQLSGGLTGSRLSNITAQRYSGTLPTSGGGYNPYSGIQSPSMAILPSMLAGMNNAKQVSMSPVIEGGMFQSGISNLSSPLGLTTAGNLLNPFGGGNNPITAVKNAIDTIGGIGTLIPLGVAAWGYLNLKKRNKTMPLIALIGGLYFSGIWRLFLPQTQDGDVDLVGTATTLVLPTTASAALWGVGGLLASHIVKRAMTKPRRSFRRRYFRPRYYRRGRRY